VFHPQKKSDFSFSAGFLLSKTTHHRLVACSFSLIDSVVFEHVQRLSRQHIIARLFLLDEDFSLLKKRLQMESL